MLSLFWHLWLYWFCCNPSRCFCHRVPPPSANKTMGGGGLLPWAGKAPASYLHRDPGRSKICDSRHVTTGAATGPGLCCGSYRHTSGAWPQRGVLPLSPSLQSATSELCSPVSGPLVSEVGENPLGHVPTQVASCPQRLTSSWEVSVPPATSPQRGPYPGPQTAPAPSLPPASWGEGARSPLWSRRNSSARLSGTSRECSSSPRTGRGHRIVPLRVLMLWPGGLRPGSKHHF